MHASIFLHKIGELEHKNMLLYTDNLVRHPRADDGEPKKKHIEYRALE